MGDLMNKVSSILPVNMDAIKNFDLVAWFEGMLAKFLPENLAQMYSAYRVVCLLAVAAILLLLAVQGYKIFKSLLYVAGAVGFAYLGYTYLLPLIPENYLGYIPEMLDASVLVAVVCALVAVFLTRVAYNFMIMLLGGGCGYLLGSIVIYDIIIKHFNTLTFLQLPAVKHIIGGVLASIFAVLFILLFKHLFMLITSFGGAACAAIVVQSILLPAADMPIKIAAIIVGIAFGIYCIVHQYKEEEKDLEIVF